MFIWTYAFLSPFDNAGTCPEQVKSTECTIIQCGHLSRFKRATCLGSESDSTG